MFQKLGWLFIVALNGSLCFASPFTPGDVFLTSQHGTIAEYTRSGQLVQSIPDPYPFLETPEFDSAGDLYVAGDGALQKFNSNGTFAGTISSLYQGPVYSVAVASDGSLWVGEWAPYLEHISPSGALLGSYMVSTQSYGTSTIGLSPDGTKILYTSGGSQIRAFDVTTKTQLPIFADSGLSQDDVVILPDGNVIVANETDVILYNASGQVVRTYVLGSSGEISSVNLDPNGTDFWASDYLTGNVYEVNIATGAIDDHFTAPGGFVDGIAIFPGIATPEPATGTILGLGVAALCIWVRRRSTGQKSANTLA